MDEYYNENEYFINHNTEALSYLERICNEYKHIKELEEKGYSLELGIYDEYLSLVVSLLRSLALKSDIEYSIALSYLIHKGYLSLTDKFDSSKTEYDIELMSHPGLNIVLGEGCCRNFADIHNDIMKKLDIISKKYYCVQSHLKLRNNTANRKANHVANTITFNDTLYVIDIFNASRLYHFTSDKEAREISFDTVGYLTYKPYYELMYNENDLNGIQRQYEIQYNESKKSYIGPYEYIDGIKSDVINKMLRQTSMIKDFDSSTMELKKLIYTGMKRQKY